MSKPHRVSTRTADVHTIQAMRSLSARNSGSFQSDIKFASKNTAFVKYCQLVAKPGERIIAIGGSGHMAILKQLLEIDRRLEAVGVENYF